MATDPIKDAFEKIGVDQSNDYKLKPTDHPLEFQTKAPAFYDILATSDVSRIARDYMAKDAEAITAQQDFANQFNRSNLMVLITAIFLIISIGIRFSWSSASLNSLAA